MDNKIVSSEELENPNQTLTPEFKQNLSEKTTQNVSAKRKRKHKRQKLNEEDKQEDEEGSNEHTTSNNNANIESTQYNNVSKWAMNSVQSIQKFDKKQKKLEIKNAKKLRKQEKSDQLKSSLNVSEKIVVNGKLDQTQDCSDELQNLISKSDENSVVKSFTIQ